MQIETRSLKASHSAPSESWFAPLAMLIAWLARMFDHIAKMKRVRRSTRFKPNWRDHFAGLRQSEWHIAQITAGGAAQLLAGQPLDLNAIGLWLDPPDDFGGPCPRTPYDMNRRFLAVARWHTDPAAAVRRHAQRIAKRAGIDLSNPLATHESTDAALRAAAHHEAGVCSESETLLTLMVSSAPFASRHARGPPQSSKIRNTHLAAPHQRERTRLPNALNPPIHLSHDDCRSHHST